VDLAIERVRTRVLEGGHNVESHVIKRRYKNGIKNLFNIYIPIVDEVMIFDNSEGKYELLAEKTKETQIDVLNKIKFNQIKQSLDETI
jgi:predicted ABC-type ATPase